MRICDKCGCESRDVTAYVVCTDMMDLCLGCHKTIKRTLERADRKALKEYYVSRGNYRSAATDAWRKSNGGMRARIKRACDKFGLWIEFLTYRNH